MTAETHPAGESAGPRRQSKRLELRRGYYLMRYGATAPGGESPVVTLGPDPGDDRPLELMGPRTGGAVTLGGDGDLAVIRVPGPEAALSVEIALPGGGTERPVDLRLERLDRAEPARRSFRSLARLSGHLSGAGETEAGADGWLGDPAGRARLEGFALHWPGGPEGVGLAYGCTVPALGLSPAARTGGFAGTRRRAAAIGSVWARLEGEGAEDFRLHLEAVFARRGRVTGQGGTVLRGDGREDRLVALRVALEARGADLSSDGTGGLTDPQTARP